MLKKVGLKGQDTAELFFEDMRLPKSALLGGEEGLNQGFPYLMQELARFVYPYPNLTPYACLPKPNLQLNPELELYKALL